MRVIVRAVVYPVLLGLFGSGFSMAAVDLRRAVEVATENADVHRALGLIFLFQPQFIA